MILPYLYEIIRHNTKITLKFCNRFVIKPGNFKYVRSVVMEKTRKFLLEMRNEMTLVVKTDRLIGLALEQKIV